MIRAFRDTWELGIHSYLNLSAGSSALDRRPPSPVRFLSLCKSEMRTSIWCVLSWMRFFGAENLMAQIIFRKKMMPLSKKPGCESMTDYILWYVKI